MQFTTYLEIMKIIYSMTDHHAMVALSTNVNSHLFHKDPWRFVYGWQCYSRKSGPDSCNRMNGEKLIKSISK